MNSKDFIHLLRKVIREEVQTAVRKEIGKFTEVIAESKKNISAKQPQNTARTQPISKPIKRYTSNPELNAILNETVGSLPTMQTLNEQVDYQDFSEWPTMSARPIPHAPKFTDINGAPVDLKRLSQTESGAAVATALTKDYSALMKAIDKKKGS